jgi:hypothetical protein
MSKFRIMKIAGALAFSIALATSPALAQGHGGHGGGGAHMGGGGHLGGAFASMGRGGGFHGNHGGHVGRGAGFATGLIIGSGFGYGYPGYYDYPDYAYSNYYDNGYYDNGGYDDAPLWAIATQIVVLCTSNPTYVISFIRPALHA